MITKPKSLQKLTIDKTPQTKAVEEEEYDEDYINDSDIDNYILPSDISHFRDIPLGQFTVLDLAGHLITTFEGINRFPSLNKLILKKTLISTFKGSVEMPNLEEIDFTDTPLSRRFYYREMTLFALGFQIRVINNKAVTQTESNLSLLSTRSSIEKTLQEGNFITSYPSSNPVSSFTALNLGFCSTISANEISSTFSEYNRRYEALKNENLNLKECAKKMAEQIAFNAKTFRRARTHFANQSKWLYLQNIHYTSQNQEIEDIRLQIQGLKPSSSYTRHINDLSNMQKQGIEIINSLEEQNEKFKKNIAEVQKNLRLETEMNFNLQLKIKGAKAGKFEISDEQIQNIQNSIDALKLKKEDLEKNNEDLKNEMNLYEQKDGKYQNEMNGVLQAAESMKKEKEESENHIKTLILNDKKQKEKIEELKSALKLHIEDNKNLELKLKELNDEIDSLKQQKEEVEKRTEQKKKEFNEKISKI